MRPNLVVPTVCYDQNIVNIGSDSLIPEIHADVTYTVSGKKSADYVGEVMKDEYNKAKQIFGDD